MVTKTHTSLPAKTIDDEIRRCGRCLVRLPNTHLEFELTRRGVEVNAGGTRYVMHQARDFERDGVVFSVTVDGRWVCKASQYGYDGTSTFEVLDWAGDPFYRPGEYVSVGTLASPANEKRKVLLLCP
jgi:hypothetical protein